jgi:hypothetical protein
MCRLGDGSPWSLSSVRAEILLFEQPDQNAVGILDWVLPQLAVLRHVRGGA